MESIPRITRAQSMDALSSQATVAGYKAVVLAADRAAAPLPDADDRSRDDRPGAALVLGAGVAGLQAIATARRLGAVVSAFDVRRREGAGREPRRDLPRSRRARRGDRGRLRGELTAEQQAQQQAALEERIPDFDVVITTAPSRAGRRRG